MGQGRLFDVATVAGIHPRATEYTRQPATRPKAAQVTVKITADDIRRAKRADCHVCPVGLAVTRAMGRTAQVNSRSASAFRPTGGLPQSADLPPEARAFVRAWDGGREVGPMAFKMERIGA